MGDISGLDTGFGGLGFRVLGFQGFRVSGFWGFRVSGLRVGLLLRNSSKISIIWALLQVFWGYIKFLGKVLSYRYKQSIIFTNHFYSSKLDFALKPGVL